jgi:hypothetical protein
MEIQSHQERYDIVILSALGCGAYKNPPEQVAECFYKALSQIQLKPKIEFAIMSDYNDVYGNFATFVNVFNKNDNS